MIEEHIILELTPREAAALYEMVCVFSPIRGDYAKETAEIYRALDDVLSAHIQYSPLSVTQFGPVNAEALWMVAGYAYPED